MLRVAAFIDAGYLWKQLDKALFSDNRKHPRADINLDYTAFHKVLTKYIKETFDGIPLLRCYWYDGSLPNGGLSSDHNKIAELNDFKLRLGSRITEGADGTTKQKGVDGLIIADLIGLAQNKVLSHALLVSGDGDMVPGVGVAQSLGMRVHLLSLFSDNATAPSLKREADFFELWPDEKIITFAQARSAPVKTSTSGASSSVESDVRAEDAASSSSPKDPEPSFANLPEKFVFLDEFFKSLEDNEKASISQTAVPYEIDCRLIRLGYEHNQCKALTESEKRNLRGALKERAQHYKKEKSGE